MRGLTADIRRLWDACSRVRASPVPGGALEIADLGEVMHCIDVTLATIRTLDTEILEDSDKASYTTLRSNEPKGRAVRALVGPRNHAVHGADLVEPDVVNALGPVPETGRYVILPRWRPASSVPTSMFEFKGMPQPSYRAACVAAAEGRSVFDTFLDAFAFFEKCDPGVVQRDAENQIAGFPLPPLPIANRYRRLHPDWPTEHEWNETERARILAAPPGGSRRVVRGRIPATDGPLLCGLTVVTEHRGSFFVEPMSQVARDLTAGYRYISEQHPDRTDLLRAAGDRVVLPGDPDLTTLPDLAVDTRPWLAWRDLCLDDADYYRRQREQAMP